MCVSVSVSVFTSSFAPAAMLINESLALKEIRGEEDKLSYTLNLTLEVSKKENCSQKDIY